MKRFANTDKVEMHEEKRVDESRRRVVNFPVPSHRERVSEGPMQCRETKNKKLMFVFIRVIIIVFFLGMFLPSFRLFFK